MSDGGLTTDIGYQHLLGKISEVYTIGQTRATQAVNVHITETYWQIGHDIVEFEQGGKARATYGKGLLDRLSRDLRNRHGKRFSRSNLSRFRQFYLAYPICAKASHKFVPANFQTLPRTRNRFSTSTASSAPAKQEACGQLCNLFDQETNHGRDTKAYDTLLQKPWAPSPPPSANGPPPASNPVEASFCRMPRNRSTKRPTSNWSRGLSSNKIRHERCTPTHLRNRSPICATPSHQSFNTVPNSLEFDGIKTSTARQPIP